VVQSPRYKSRLAQWVAGDWQLAPIVGFHTGSYFNITSGVDSALNGIGGQRPNQTLSNPYCANRSYACWLNGNAFGTPGNGAFGTLGFDNLVGPNYFNVDLSLSRRFPVKERQYFEIRAEAFNLQNRVNFLNPSNPGLVGNASGSALNSSNFGKILSDVGPRIMQFAMKYAF
jgi:hypothetical protein